MQIFFVGSLHKWCYATKSTAVLWVHPKHQDWIRPHMVGVYYKKTFKNDFFWLGSNDSTRYFCVEDALDFYERIGGYKVISQHINEMLDFWEDLLIQSFQVSPAPIPKSMRAPFMRLIEFPKSKMYPEMTYKAAGELMSKLANEYGVYINIKILYGKAWIRLSANVNNTREDYIKMRDRLAEALQIQVNKEQIYSDKGKMEIEKSFRNLRRGLSRGG